MKVLITAPSLNEAENVSGISTLVRNIIAYGKQEFVHFEAGRKDGEPAGAGWLLRQAALPVRFFAALQRVKPDIVHINTAFIPLAIYRDAALAFAASLSKRKVVLHIHGGPYVSGTITSAALKAAADKLIDLSTIAVVFSEAERKSLLSQFPKAKTRVLPNAVPLREIPKFERRPGERTMIFFGRLNASKGLDHIVDACRVLRDQGFGFRYVCYGAGPEKERFLMRMTDVLGEAFEYRGIASGKEKWKALAEADILFQPSRDEGLPIAMLEAMAAGCIPVMAASGAVESVIQDGHNGFIVEAGNTVQTVGRLKVLLSESRTGWEELRENARRTVEEKYDFDRYLDTLGKIYDEAARK